jgi:hypothetical protein
MQEGWNDSKADLLALRRIAVGTDDHLLALKLKLVGLPELRRRFRRLIKT